MANFFIDNSDLRFRFDQADLREIVGWIEQDYTQAERFDYAPRDYDDAKDSYRRILEVVGDLAANFIAPRAASVDEEGNHLADGRVTYAKGTREALDQLARAELMGVTLPREHGGLNFPTTVYVMAIEMISRADASLMNIYGLQDVAETIHRYGSAEQQAEFLPKFCSGEVTGAMVLTEPDAGSDLQAVKLQAYQDDAGTWRLRGVKRFITNGCGEVLLVLARSEPKSKDGRGLSLFVCYGDDGVKVRRIENKLGIHGSPTCELQFDDTPAQLVGRRKFGLIKYVMDLMNSARLGVSAQALGIAQAAYDEALRYARARKQFGQTIYHIPVVANMLVEMRVTLEANRALLYATTRWVDTRDRLSTRVAELRAAGKSFSDESDRLKEASKICGLLTPLTKYVLSEASNSVCYDALQIHGGAGYMKEFPVERMARDARITNIYEGTSQMQVVAAINGVMGDLLGPLFAHKAEKGYDGPLARLAEKVAAIRKLFVDSQRRVTEKGDKTFHDVAARELVQMYAYIYIGYLLLDDAEVDERKIFVARRYIVAALAAAQKNAQSIIDDQFSDLLHVDKILFG